MAPISVAAVESDAMKELKRQVGGVGVVGDGLNTLRRGQASSRQAGWQNETAGLSSKVVQTQNSATSPFQYTGLPCAGAAAAGAVFWLGK